jgi:hypothetical protein
MFSVKIDERQIQKFLRRSPRRARWANAEALKMTGGHLRKSIRAFIEAGGKGWPPLSPLTAAGKKHQSPLYFLGRLVRFKYGVSRGRQRVRIGFFPTRTLTKRQRLKTGRRYAVASTQARRAQFQRSFNMTHQALARLHEFGRRRRVTARMRGYFAYTGRPLKKITKVLTIPARPMIGPVFRAQRREIPRYYAARFFQKFFGNQKPRLGF